MTLKTFHGSESKMRTLTQLKHWRFTAYSAHGCPGMLKRLLMDRSNLHNPVGFYFMRATKMVTKKHFINTLLRFSGDNNHY